MFFRNGHAARFLGAFKLILVEISRDKETIYPKTPRAGGGGGGGAYHMVGTVPTRMDDG